MKSTKKPTPKKISVGLLGSSGKMGQQVASLITGEFSERFGLAAQVSSKSPVAPLLKTDVVIDFSRPAGVLKFLDAVPKAGALPALVIGSTGWTPKELSKLTEYARRAPVLMSANFSKGVGALRYVLEQNAPLFDRLGFTPVIVETHHRHKKDAPSGTAIWLSETISKKTGKRPDIQSVRAGDVVGDHEITYYGVQESVKFAHYAIDRTIFARGALDVAGWLLTQKTPKLYSMEDFFK